MRQSSPRVLLWALLLCDAVVGCGDDDDSSGDGDADSDADADADADADTDGDGDGDADADGDGDADADPDAVTERLEHSDPGEWTSFKRNQRHTGLAGDMTGDITRDTVCVRWAHPVTGPSTRGAGGALVANVDGTWTVFVAVDGNCADDGTACESGGPLAPETPGKVYALDGSSGDVIWSDLLDEPAAQADPYAPLLADVDADGRRELIVPSTDRPYVFAYTTADEGDGAGAREWVHELPPGHRSEAAPAAANLDPSDDDLEILIGDDADPSEVEGDTARFYAISGFDGSTDGEVGVPNRQEIDDDGCAGGRKLDSSQTAIARVDGRWTGFVGAWNGSFYAFAWIDGALDVAWRRELPLDESGDPCLVPKVRSSAVIADLDGDGDDELAFGYMYQEGLAGDPTPFREEAAVLILLDASSGEPIEDAVMGDWKSSPSAADLDPDAPGLELVAGHVGGIYSVDHGLGLSWAVGPAGSEARGVRSSPAVADIDDDGHLEVLIGLEGDGDATEVGLYCLDGATGAAEWNVPLGLDGEYYVGASSSPAVGDIDGDGRLEIVILGADGVLYAVDEGDDCR